MITMEPFDGCLCKLCRCCFSLEKSFITFCTGMNCIWKMPLCCQSPENIHSGADMRSPTSFCRTARIHRIHWIDRVNAFKTSAAMNDFLSAWWLSLWPRLMCLCIKFALQVKLCLLMDKLKKMTTLLWFLDDRQQWSHIITLGSYLNIFEFEYLHQYVLPSSISLQPTVNFLPDL